MNDFLSGGYVFLVLSIAFAIYTLYIEFRALRNKRRKQRNLSWYQRPLIVLMFVYIVVALLMLFNTKSIAKILVPPWLLVISILLWIASMVITYVSSRLHKPIDRAPWPRGLKT